jgi:hypothetical protein
MAPQSPKTAHLSGFRRCLYENNVILPNSPIPKIEHNRHAGFRRGGIPVWYSEIRKKCDEL